MSDNTTIEALKDRVAELERHIEKLNKRCAADRVIAEQERKTMSNLEGIKKQVAKLPYSELDELGRTVRNFMREEEAQARKEEEKKLNAFVNAVRKAGLQKELKVLKMSKTVKLPVLIFWDHDTAEAENPSEIGVSVVVGDGSACSRDETLAKVFKPELVKYQKKVFGVFKKLKRIVEKHGVEEMNWEDAISFIWGED